MRRALLLPALLVPSLLVPVLLLAACNPRDLILETEVAPEARDELTRGCCDCLTDAAAFLPEEEQGCDEDAGIRGSTPCACGGLDAETCGDRLIAGEDIAVVGACTRAGGVCWRECEGVLAYP